MAESEIFNKIVKLIQGVLENNETVTQECTLVADLMFDSVSMLYLQVAIEDEFDIRFDPLMDDFGSIFYSVNNLCKYISRKINGDGTSEE